MDIKAIESQYLKAKKPQINIGNTVKVYIKIKEGNKERIQAFEGIVIKKKGTGVNETFTVRKIGAHGVGVERTFLINSPKVERVEVLKIGRVRRAKLYYLRDRIGKKAKLREDLYAVLKRNSQKDIEEEIAETVAEAVAEEEKIAAEEAEKVEEQATETVAEEPKEEVKAEATEEAKAEETAEDASKE